jgi:hypothetical protein
MTRTRAAARLVAASAVLAAALVGAAPAIAATLPAGATIDVVANEGGIYSVNPSTAVGSLVGTASGVLQVAAIDVNQSGQGYAIAQADGGSQLYAANAVTGTLEYIADITNGGNAMPGCQAIDLSNAGVLTASCLVDIDPDVSIIGEVSRTTGAFTGWTDYATDDNDIVRALASNSAGVLYYFTEFGRVAILNTSTGESTFTVNVDGRVLAADFDITDQLWVTIGAEGEEPIVGNSLGTLSVATGVLTGIAEYSSPEVDDFDTTSITVWGGAIANTGSTGVDLVPVGLGAMLLVIAGVALAATHRISSRRRATKPE